MDILVLIYLCFKNSHLAQKKAVNRTKWVLLTIGAWLSAEILGLIIGYAFWGLENLVGLMAFALFCAFGGYLLIRRSLESLPEPMDEDINRIGTKDLEPPKL